MIDVVGRRAIPLAVALRKLADDLERQQSRVGIRSFDYTSYPEGLTLNFSVFVGGAGATFETANALRDAFLHG